MWITCETRIKPANIRNTAPKETCERDGASTRNFSAEKYPCSFGTVFLMFADYLLLSGGDIINRHQHRSDENTNTKTKKNNHGRLDKIHQVIHSGRHFAGIKGG